MKKINEVGLSACPVCLSKNTYELYPANVDLKKIMFTYEFTPQSQKTFRVARCRKCTHAFCSPLPRNMYKNYEDVIDKEYLRHSQTRRLSSQSVLDIIRNYASGGKVFDIGCATGDFLSVAKSFGYSAEGLELSRWSAEIARKKDITVYMDRLKVLAQKFPARYDIVTMWGVIEHFQFPRDEMLCINRLLKPGGLLVIWTGNIDGIMSRILGRRWWYWQGQHIQYFTSRSLNSLASLFDFEHLITKRYPIAATYEQVNNSLKRYKFHKYLMPLIKLLFLIKPIWYLRLPGEMLWLGRKAFDK